MNTSSNTTREELLRIRAEFLLHKPDAFAGNHNERRHYLEKLEKIKPDLTNFQKKYLIGLILGDATVELDYDKKTARVKMQQTKEHEGWMKTVKQIFLEYMPNDKPFSPPSKNRINMLEMQTLKCKVFYDFLEPIFYRSKNRKSIFKDQITRYIDCVCVAAWFCGDGSKSDHSKNNGKGLALHSQGFTQEENHILADSLKSNLDFNCDVISERTRDKDKDKWRLEVRGPSYEKFVTDVGPYIDETFHPRVPLGRVDGSRYGDMTATKRASFLGSKMNSIDELVKSY